MIPLRTIPPFGAALAALIVTGCRGASTRDPSDEVGPRDAAVDELHDAAVVLSEVAHTRDNGVPLSVRRDARCVAIVPSVVKAAFVVGAEHGRGVASCRTAAGWSAPAFFQVSGGSFGLQIGVQSTDLVLYVMNDEGMRKLLDSKVELGADAAVAAGPLGRDAAAGTDGKLGSEVLAYSRSRGLFAGVDLKGAVLTEDKGRARAVYGADRDFRALLEGRVASPAAANELASALLSTDVTRAR